MNSWETIASAWAERVPSVPLRVSEPQAARLDALAEALWSLCNASGAPDASPVREGFAAVQEIALGQPQAGPLPGRTQWEGLMQTYPHDGGAVLGLTQPHSNRQRLSFYQDAAGAICAGALESLNMEQSAGAVGFEVRRRGQQWELAVSNGKTERHLNLGADVPGLAWTESPQLSPAAIQAFDVPENAEGGLLQLLGMPALPGAGLVTNVVQSAVEALRPPPMPPPQAGPPRQWFYAREQNSIGPVAEAELAALLEKGEVPWDTLVWHRALPEWTPAARTELASLAGPGVPPPLPPKRSKP